MGFPHAAPSTACCRVGKYREGGWFWTQFTWMSEWGKQGGEEEGLGSLKQPSEEELEEFFRGSCRFQFSSGSWMGGVGQPLKMPAQQLCVLCPKGHTDIQSEDFFS